jgi:nucleoside 2-deoxyribosyltransferase
MSDKIIIYSAAALFNARETCFNSQLVEGLEKLGYGVDLPQRDGFEFGNLAKILSGKLQHEQINSSIQNIIYLLDMGIFIPRSDIVLANFDEPLDEGVVVEASYAKLMGKFIIGLRTDVRSPYGAPNDNFKGMHFFPALQTHKFISHYVSSKTPKEREEQMNSLVQKIHTEIQSAGISHKETTPEYVKSNPNIYPVLEGAQLLFRGVEDIHSEKGLEEITSRFILYKKRLEEITPKI